MFDEFGIELVSNPSFGIYDAVIIAVSHDIFVDMGVDKIKSFCKGDHLVYDLKYAFPKFKTDMRL